MSRTSSGMGIQRSVLTSCLISSMGKSGANASGPIGSWVAGCRGGSGLLGMSAVMLYQFSGMSRSDRVYLVWSLMSMLLK